ncbi:hypothetical protein B0T21DRAFT_357382 [Apiosordaria backusii]|uniref:Uncharacterized protein n=1 Tax=Apiosordaria backusii TaxID=314023 RepID=A0AA40F0E3_9PEZI|nr:hypothetical protein B0T21DRAFT_357382 [Apiosordaria backusii]
MVLRKRRCLGGQRLRRIPRSAFLLSFSCCYLFYDTHPPPLKFMMIIYLSFVSIYDGLLVVYDDQKGGGNDG